MAFSKPASVSGPGAPGAGGQDTFHFVYCEVPPCLQTQEPGQVSQGDM